ncbi:MAG: AAA family ATPase [Deltaproteobacteria bacterium]|jgi:hypothetical protein|nr:AAA family ATPase [Deltaproteobacteria bacterium]
MAVLKGLPLGNQTFAKIIDQNLVYADKTKLIYFLVTSTERNYFLSRPRRFGKTLLLSTLDELFNGERARFQNLWIGQSDYDFPKIPVIHLSLSMEAQSTQSFKNDLMAKLKVIADLEKLKVREASLAVYFGFLIKALSHQRDNSKVAVLIDEYDAPVTRAMGDEAMATANAKVLHDFFAILKDPMVAPCVRFTLVTGVTRYALNSIDSGPNHLNDISLDPKYAGLCGFTLAEFDALFADRLGDTLSKLKKNGQIESSVSQEVLRKKIFNWYDGYDWGDGTRVLNPYSILKFFESNNFDSHWIQSGRPGHLTALIRKKPLDFLFPKLESYLSTEVRKSELTQLQAVPVLFHSGYLTIDKVTKVQVENPLTKEKELVSSYSFRLPNFEVSSAYYRDCFEVIFGREPKELIANGVAMRQAILSKDAKAVSSILEDLLTSLSYSQRPSEEKDFHAFIHLILASMGLNVVSEQSGYNNRLDICVDLSEGVYVIIELKYRSDKKKLTKADETKALAEAAMETLPRKRQDEILAKALRNSIDNTEIMKIIRKNSEKTPSKSEINKILANVAIESLSKDNINQVLAEAARNSLSGDAVKKVLTEATPSLDISKEEIDELLSETAQKALSDISTRNYHGIVNYKAKQIIDLGLAIYGGDATVKALFG